MICEKCGAPAVDGAAVCPECGEPMVRTGALSPAMSVPAKPAVSVPAQAGSSKRPAWLIPAVAAIALIAIVAAGVFLWPKAALTGPGGAATRMLEAYAAYDGAGMLENATHASMTTTDVAAFEKQVADAKAASGGKPNLTDLQIMKTTVDPKDPNTAVVQVSAQWLTDPVKGTYTQRTDQLSVVYKDGRWLVQLF